MVYAVLETMVLQHGVLTSTAAFKATLSEKAHILDGVPGLKDEFEALRKSIS